MQENKIAEALMANLPRVAEPQAPAAKPINTDEPSSETPDELVDEMLLYKLTQFFDEPYNAINVQVNEQVKYIFLTVAEQIGTTEYGFVMDRVAELQRMLGLNHNPHRLNKLHTWLKLDRSRSNIEAEMRSLSG